MRKQIAFLTAASILGCTLVSGPVSAETVLSGSCGTDCTWTLGEDGTLTITGTGKIDDCRYWSDAPWSAVCGDVSCIVVEDGITAIGNSAFECCWGAESAEIAASVRSIGNRSFYDCTSLSEITVPDGLESIQTDAFYGCDALKELTIPASVETIGLGAFGICTVNDSLIAGAVDDSQTIYGYQGTGAEAYALSWGLHFIPLDPCTKGDVNGDGSVDAFDAAMLKRYLQAPESGRIHLTSANLDGSSHSYHYKEYQNAAPPSTADAVNEADLQLLMDLIMGKE